MSNLTAFLVMVYTNGYELVYRWGYLGLFILSLMEGVTLSLFPLPTIFFVFTFGRILNPFLVGTVSGLGSAIGSIVGYVFGRGSNDLVEKKYGKQLDKIRKRFDKHSGFWWLVVLGVIPVTSNLIGLFCGFIEYDFKKYFLATLISKLFITLLFSYAGFYSIGWVLEISQINNLYLT
jgi:membrane protein YqaA with SNARE-associated domain